MSDDIRWSKDKHDSKVISKEQMARLARAQEAQRSVAKAWHNWRRRLQDKRKPNNSDLLKMLYSMMELVKTHCADVPETSEWAQTTVMLLEDKIAEGIATDWGARNSFMAYVPTFAGKDQANLPSALQEKTKRIVFTTRQELEQMPEVARVMQKEGFINLVIQGQVLIGLFEDGEYVQVGMVSNQVGIEAMPTLEQWQEEIKKKTDK